MLYMKNSNELHGTSFEYMDGEERRKVAEANGTESAAPDVNGFKAMEVPVVDVVANGAAIQDKMMKKKKKKKAESQAAVHSQG
ncbi:unnamed protein product [Sphagnum tenellum]